MTRLEIMNDKLNKGWKPDWSTPPIQSSVMITIYYVFLVWAGVLTILWLLLAF